MKTYEKDSSAFFQLGSLVRVHIIYTLLLLILDTEIINNLDYY